MTLDVNKLKPVIKILETFGEECIDESETFRDQAFRGLGTVSPDHLALTAGLLLTLGTACKSLSNVIWNYEEPEEDQS
jgi:hypothetical protein